MKSTKVELVAALIEAQKRAKKRSQNLVYVIARARNGKYHDWESDLDMPKVQLVADLVACRGVDLSDIVAAVQDGEYDETPTQAQLEELRAEVGPETFDRMFPEDAKRRGEA